MLLPRHKAILNSTFAQSKLKDVNSSPGAMTLLFESTFKYSSVTLFNSRVPAK